MLVTFLRLLLGSGWDTAKFRVSVDREQWLAAQRGERVPLLYRVQRRRRSNAGDDGGGGGVYVDDFGSVGGAGRTSPPSSSSSVPPKKVDDGWRMSATVVRPRDRFTSWPDLSDEEPDPCGHNENRHLNPNAAPDRMNAVFLIMCLLGIGALMPWNMFITAKSYFEDYKLGPKVLGENSWHRANFMLVLTIASQFPTFSFTWVNVFVNVGGDFTRRVVGSLVVMIVVFVCTVALAMIDTSDWAVVFFWLTIASVMVLNSVNAVFQNTVYGIAAKLPPKYMGVVVLGTNISGTFTSIINIVAMALSPNPRSAAVYYFITALFVLLACFDAYFGLPLSRFYRYHTRLHDMPRRRNGGVKSDFPAALTGDAEVVRRPVPRTKLQIYCYTFSKCWVQAFNAFFTLFVTLAVFPSVMAGVQMSDNNFITGKEYFGPIVVFLTFNLFAMIGNLLPSIFLWPGPRFLAIPVILRALFIPACILCNYRPLDVERIMPVMIDNDWIFWAISIGIGITSGYFSSLSMMYGPATVEPEYASTAGMLCGACLVSGIFVGIVFSFLPPLLVGTFTW